MWKRNKVNDDRTEEEWHMEWMTERRPKRKWGVAVSQWYPTLVVPVNNNEIVLSSSMLHYLLFWMLSGTCFQACKASIWVRVAVQACQDADCAQTEPWDELSTYLKSPLKLVENEFHGGEYVDAFIGVLLWN